MKRGQQLREFADEHGLALISIEDLIRYRRRNETPGRSGSPRPGCRPCTATFAALRLPQPRRRLRAHRVGARRPRRRGGRARPHALRVPDRRRLRLAPMRLRRPAAGGAGPDRRARARRGGLPARPRGPRHRPAAQAAGVHVAGRRPRHRRRQPRARAARPTRATTAPARRSCTSSGSRSVRLLTNNPAKRTSAGGLRHRGASSASPLPSRPTTTTARTYDQARPDGPRADGPSTSRRRPTRRSTPV